MGPIRSSWVQAGAVRRRFYMNMFPEDPKWSCSGTFEGIFVAQERGETLRETFRGDLLPGGFCGNGGGAVGGGELAVVLEEIAAEEGLVGEAELEGNVLDAVLGVFQEAACLVDHHGGDPFLGRAAGLLLDYS